MTNVVPGNTTCTQNVQRLRTYAQLDKHNSTLTETGQEHLVLTRHLAGQTEAIYLNNYVSVRHFKTCYVKSRFLSKKTVGSKLRVRM